MIGRSDRGWTRSLDSWRGVNLEAKVVTCMAIRTEIGFAIHRAQLGTVACWVDKATTLEKNAVNGHFG